MNNLSDKAFFRIAMTISVVVFLLVVLLNKRVLSPPDAFPAFIYKLPLFHAIINGTCAILLIFSLRAIKAGKVALHKKINLTTFGLSALFLISYVIYHFFVPETSYGGGGILKTSYYIVLLTHIPLAAAVLPLILLSFWYALTGKIDKHKKIVRFTYPIWLYVAVTGVIVYVMISPYYQFA
jgi:putative membrane protein